jgi:hypothetical protein
MEIYLLILCLLNDHSQCEIGEYLFLPAIPRWTNVYETKHREEEGWSTRKFDRVPISSLLGEMSEEEARKYPEFVWKRVS